MNTSTTMDETSRLREKDPIQLSQLRAQKGYSIDYVADKLHLRVRIIELLEDSAFDCLPEPVFVKGYLRAYAKLLGVSPDPFLAQFDNQYDFENKPERMLWQSRRPTNTASHMIRWFTISFALAVLLAVGIWWQKNREVQGEFSKTERTKAVALEAVNPSTQLADLTSVQSLVLPDTQISFMDEKDV